MKRTTKRRTSKKSFTTTEKVILTGGILAGAWALYKYVLKPIISPDQITPETTTPASELPAAGSGGSSSSSSSSTSASSAVPFNPNKVLKYNSPPSKELEYSKMAFNSEIELARKKQNDHTLDDPTRSRLKAIADLPLLDTKTKFGKETKKVAKVILGKEDFTYNGVKTQKINMWIALGLGNPYN